MEGRDNLRLICGKCAEETKERTQAELKSIHLDSLVGHHAKLRFEDGPEIEHLWIKIEKYDLRGFKGVVYNEPVAVRNVRIGDKVWFAVSEIEEVLISH